MLRVGRLPGRERKRCTPSEVARDKSQTQISLGRSLVPGWRSRGFLAALSGEKFRRTYEESWYQRRTAPKRVSYEMSKFSFSSESLPERYWVFLLAASLVCSFCVSTCRLQHPSTGQLLSFASKYYLGSFCLSC